MQQPGVPTEQDEDERHREQQRRNEAIIALLNAWEQEDPEEQRETLEYLMRVLDEDRPSSRKLFS